MPCTAPSHSLVGYFGKSHSAVSASYGAAFIPVAGGETYKLGEISVTCANPEDNPFDPDSEYFQLLDPSTTGVIGRYTCLTKEMADFYRNMMGDDATANLIEANLGWWDFTQGKTLANIAAGTCTCRNNEPIKVGQGFLLSTSSDGRTFTSAGAVPATSRAIETAAVSPFIASFCPAPIKLSQITVESAEPEDNPFDPDSEYLQVLDPSTTATIYRYTCLTQEMADFYRNMMGDDDTANLIEANLGWWDFAQGKTLANIAAGTCESRDNVDVNPGDAFLCSISSTGRSFNIPSAIPAQD